VKMRKVLNNDRGTTLIEVLIALTLLGFVGITFFHTFSTLSVGSVAAEYRSTGNFVAQDLMEEIASKQFDELAGAVGGNWSTIGLDAGETAGDKSTFDDVDDFHLYTDNLGATYVGLTRTVDVIYVAGSDLDVASTSDNNFKRVSIEVTNGGTIFATLVSVFSSARN